MKTWSLFVWSLTALGCGGRPPGNVDRVAEALTITLPPAPCAAITLTPRGDGGATHTYSFGATETPIVGITSVTGSLSRSVHVESCTGSRILDDEIVRTTGGWLPTSIWTKAAGEPCVRIRASASIARGVATETAEVHRGDYAVHGHVTLPLPTLVAQRLVFVATPAALATPATPATPAVGALDVEVDIGRAVYRTRTAYDGSFTIEHVPPGTLSRVRVHARRARSVATLAGDVAPLTILSVSNPSAEVVVPLVWTAPEVDRFEPDDSWSAVSTRTPITLGAVQSHVLSSPRDVDVVPIAVTAGKRITTRLTKSHTHGGDVVFRILRPLPLGDVVLATAGTRRSDLQIAPTITLQPTFTGTVYAQIYRADREPVGAAYDLSVVDGSSDPITPPPPSGGSTTTLTTTPSAAR